VNIRRVAGPGLALLAAGALALAGCGTTQTTSGGTGTGAASSPSPTLPAPKDAVLASVKTLSETTYKYTLSSDGLDGTGAADPVAKKASMSIKGDKEGQHVSLDVILIDTNIWIKMDLGAAANKTIGIPNKFMHIDQHKLKDKASLGFSTDDSDPAESVKLLKGLVEVQRVDPQHYTATLDLTQVTASSVDKEKLDKLGDKAKSVPATITLDDQGRLIGVTVDLSAVDPSATIKVTYSDFGAPVTINPPAKSNVVEAPKNVYDMFNS
jgi:hypothetical protein